VAVAVAVAQPLSSDASKPDIGPPSPPKEPDDPPPFELLPPLLEVPPLLEPPPDEPPELLPEDVPKNPCDSGVDPHAAPMTSEATATANGGLRVRWLMAILSRIIGPGTVWPAGALGGHGKAARRYLDSGESRFFDGSRYAFLAVTRTCPRAAGGVTPF
jgi:hypothetical protein